MVKGIVCWYILINNSSFIDNIYESF
jgi:hypothetical protein